MHNYCKEQMHRKIEQNAKIVATVKNQTNVFFFNF